MNSILAPIILILIVIASRNIIARLYKKISRSKMSIVIAAYFVVLLVAGVIYYLLPIDNSDQTLASEEDIIKIMTDTHRALEPLESNEIVDFAHNDLFIKNGEWSFPYNNEEIYLMDISSMTENMYIVIEETDIDEVNQQENQKIEIVNYKTTSIINGQDITDKLMSPNVSLVDKSIFLDGGERLRIETIKFKKDFTLLQFSKDKDYRMESGHGLTTFGRQIMHIKVPANVEVYDKTFATVYYIG